MHAIMTIADRIAARLRNLRGWRRYAAAFGAGSFCCLGLPPLGWFPVLWIGFPVLAWLLQGAEKTRQAFNIGWCFAFGYFLFGLYWIAAAMFVDLARFGWMIPVTAAGLPALFGCYYGLSAVGWQIMRQRLDLRGVSAALTLAWLFALTEYVRGTLFTGFPWNLFGYVWTEFPPVAQSASLFGLYGLTLLTIAAAILPSTLTVAGASAPRGNAIIANGAAFGILVTLGLWGGWRLQTPASMIPDVYMRLVQPAIAQNLKWDPAEREGNFNRLLEMTAQPAARPVTHVIWPETAAAYFLAEELPRRLQIAAVLPEHAVLLTGALRAEGEDNFNSLLALDRSGAVLDFYDKFHLVPFGEYVPFRRFGPIAAVAAGLGGGFTPGPGPRSLRVPGLPPFSPLVCYEVIFPHRVADPHDRPQLLVNVTNDAWYGKTAGPHQHLAIARMRAIEEGLPLIRVANTGISAIIDAYGRTVQSLPLGTRGVIDSPIPAAAGARTLASRAGEVISLSAWALLGSGILIFGRHRRKNSA